MMTEWTFRMPPGYGVGTVDQFGSFVKVEAETKEEAVAKVEALLEEDDRKYRDRLAGRVA